MLIVGVLNGYSASRRHPHTAEIVQQSLVAVTCDFALCAQRASLLGSGERALRRFLTRQARAHPHAPALLVGKSLGAWHLVEGVLPRLPAGAFAELYLCTLDPCQPTWRDWTPNCNSKTLRLTVPVTRACNLYVRSPDAQQQCGAPLAGLPGTPVENLGLDARHGYDHYNVVQSQAFRRTLADLIQEARRG